MKHLIALLLLCCGLAHAAPPCYPELGTAANVTSGAATLGKFSGKWRAHWCPDGWGDWTLHYGAFRDGYTPRYPPNMASMSTKAALDAAWALNVTPCETTQDVILYDLCARAKVAGYASRPKPPYIVRASGSSTSRPTYALTSTGALGAQNGTVPILDATGWPTPCNPAQRAASPYASYMQVKRTPGTVALCSATQ